MADALVGAGLGSLLGIGKYAGDLAGNANDKAKDAVIAKFSPWTKVDPTKLQPRKANFLGDVLPAGITGAMIPGIGKALGLGGATGATAADLGADAGGAVGGIGSLAGEGAMGMNSLSPWAAIAQAMNGA